MFFANRPTLTLRAISTLRSPTVSAHHGSCPPNGKTMPSSRRLTACTGRSTMQSFKQPPACFNITESAAWPPFGNNPSRSIRPDLPLYGLMFKAKRSICAFLRKALFCLMQKCTKEKHPRAEASGCDGCLMFRRDSSRPRCVRCLEWRP